MLHRSEQPRALAAIAPSRAIKVTVISIGFTCRAFRKPGRVRDVPAVSTSGSPAVAPAGVARLPIPVASDLRVAVLELGPTVKAGVLTPAASVVATSRL